MKSSPKSILEHKFDNVNTPSNTGPDNKPDNVIHHKVVICKIKSTGKIYKEDIKGPYSVSPSYRVIPRSMIIKRLNLVRECLENVIGLTPHQREVALALVRYWIHYGKVYPKAETVARDICGSKATYWRTVRILRDLGLLEVVNRYLVRHDAQISNLYRLDKLVMIIAKYLAEHTGWIWPDWVKSIIFRPWPEFWLFLNTSLVPGDSS